MKKTNIAIMLSLFIAGFSCCGKDDKDVDNAQNTDPVSMLPKDAAWELDASKSDEFDNLDGSKWNADPLWYWDGVSDELIAYKPENTTVADGKASLSVKKEDFKTYHYTGGCLKSKFEVGGDTYIEIRAKMIDKLANVCAAIWLGDEPQESKNPNIEIDMQETKDADNAPHKVNSSLLTWPKPGNGNTVPGYTNFYIAKGLDEDFHLYGLERKDGKLSFYLDGINYWVWDAAETPEFVTQLRPIILSIEGHAGNPVDSYLPSDFQVDWVRVYNAK